MNYNEIIKPYIIDFDKLEVGQTLWSVIDGKARVNEFDSDAYPIKVGMFYFTKDGKKHENDKYPTLFTANPFENMQRGEPLEAETTEERDIRCGKVSAKFDKKGTKTLINRLEKRGYNVIPDEVEREVWVRVNDMDNWKKRKLLAIIKGYPICEDINHPDNINAWGEWKEIEEPSYDQLLKFWNENK